ncbi:MAG: hypothetical protein ACLGG0_14820 [Bacteriovoracia bacterium]
MGTFISNDPEYKIGIVDSGILLQDQLFQAIPLETKVIRCISTENGSEIYVFIRDIDLFVSKDLQRYLKKIVLGFKGEDFALYRVFVVPRFMID